MSSVCRRIRLDVKKEIDSPPISVELHMFDFDIGIDYRKPNKVYFAKMLEGAKNIGVSKEYMNILPLHEIFVRKFISKL